MANSAEVSDYLKAMTNGLRPFRIFTNVKNTPIGPMMRSGQTAPIIDFLNLGMQYKVTRIQLLTIATPALSTTITVKSNGTAFFTTTIIAASVPAVGKLLDLLTITNLATPNLSLPASLTVEATYGTYEVFIDGVLF